MNNLTLLIGEDYKLIDFYLNDIITKISNTEENKIVYDLISDSFSDILDEASMISLFGTKKIIIGNNFDISTMKDGDISYLEKYCRNVISDNYIVLIAKKIDYRLKKAKIFSDNFNIIDTNKTNNSNKIRDFYLNYIKENGFKIDDYILDYLVDKLGDDINNIKIELDKIFLYKNKDNFIDKDTISLLIPDNIDNIMYEFTNAVIDKDYNKVSKMYSNFKNENMSFDYLLVSLANVFRQSLIIKILSNRKESNLSISSLIGKKEYFVKKMQEKLYSYSIKDICDNINKLAIIDREIKMGISNYDALELFLLGK